MKRPRRVGRPKGWKLLAVIGAVLSMAVGTNALAADIGPLPGIEVNKKKAAIGKRLFYDPRLSGDAAISCASCHDPKHAFSEGVALGKAYPGTKAFRNAPGLINTALKQNWFHDGRIGTSLNDVTRNEITETIVMNMDMRIMQERIKQDPVYLKMFMDAGMGEPSNGKVRNLIPEFLKTLRSKNVPFDKGELSGEAKKGLVLFKGKAGCIRCHDGPLFTDGKPHKTGVPENPDIYSDPYRHITKVAFDSFLGVDNYMNVRQDVGYYITNKEKANVGKFITSSLRELKHTAPYMHNGMLASLEEVIEFYNRGGGKGSELAPLNLNGGEKKQLKAFLLSLSGDLLTGSEYVVGADELRQIMKPYEAIEDWYSQKN